ncbi:hypothetical protein [Paraburkholderia sp. SIMBA_054]|uniref:hypothetical protein n=1 Tax=Paraburkholderia sp. SIMBA_054 TaxID=3085795 RepID=UPI00397E35D3
MKNANYVTVEAVRIVKPGAQSQFDLRRPFVLKHHIPYAAAVPGTDMGEQIGGDYYWGLSSWTSRRQDAQRYTGDSARTEQARLAERGTVGVELEDANVLEARLLVMTAVSRANDEVLPRDDFLALLRKVAAIPDEHFANAVADLDSRGDLTEPTILAISGLGGHVQAGPTGAKRSQLEME